MAKADDRDQRLETELALLREEYEKLKEDKVRTEQNLSNLEQQLAELETRAQEEYGSADPGELERLLEEKRGENERLVREYREHVRAIQEGLEALERESGEGD
jgi:chromosome segregation ATPase